MTAICNHYVYLLKSALVKCFPDATKLRTENSRTVIKVELYGARIVEAVISKVFVFQFHCNVYNICHC